MTDPIQNKTAEVWKDVPDSNGRYEVSNRGRLRRWTNQRGNRMSRPRLLHPYKKHRRQGRRTKYCRAHLQIQGKDRSLLVHRLVAQAFISNPNDYPHINHKDGNGTNNNIDNLEWCTASQNFIHSQLYLKHKGIKLTKEKREQAFAWLAEGITQQEIARRLGVDTSQISRLKTGDNWNYA